MAGKGADRATAHVLSVGMSPVTMVQGEKPCRDKEQGKTEGREKTEPYGPMLESHDALVSCREYAEVPEVGGNIALSALKRNRIAHSQKIDIQGSEFDLVPSTGPK